ncbi:MAG: tetratricopeptide repeat protein [Candidatus Omnitrophota bacterium]
MDQYNIKRLPSTFFLIGLGCIAELLVGPIWLQQGSLLSALLLHLGASLLLAVGFIKFKKNAKQKELRAVYFFGLMLVVFFPCFGLPMGILVIVWVRRGQKSHLGIYEEYEEYIEHVGGKDTYGSLYLRQLDKLRGDIGFESYIDIIKGDNDNIKQRVIEKLSRNATVHSVKLLKMALSDLSPEVRLGAANALLKIEKTINDKIQTALNMTKQRGVAQDYTNLGGQYRGYAFIGLMEKKSSDHYMLLACQAYQQSLDLDTNQASVIKDYAEILLAVGDYEKAQKFLDNGIQIWPDDWQMHLLRAETYFLRRRFECVEGALYGMTSQDLSPLQVSALKFWSAKHSKGS